jgi:hypothetical protein
MNNNNTILAMVFLIAGTLLTSIVTMVPLAAYAGGDDNKDDDKDDDKKRYNGDGNQQKVEDESAGAIADCDDNKVAENAHFECHASTGIRFTGQDLIINGISRTLLSDEVDPSPQEDNLPMALPLPL